MNKQELLQALSQKTGLNKRDAQKLLSALGEIITETLISGERLQLTGFGTFDTVELRPDDQYIGKGYQAGICRAGAVSKGAALLMENGGKQEDCSSFLANLCLLAMLMN